MNTPSAEAAAKEILRLAVWQLNTEAGHAFSPGGLVRHFSHSPWSPELLDAGRRYAAEMNWIASAGQRGIVILTAAGVAAAPEEA
ncbi:hypothetical protein [Reyranella sp.]|uniref:hypothetical protein n=1 Tax=Reyranella sp. TaxID=1929291 RepID=UPI00403624F6